MVRPLNSILGRVLLSVPAVLAAIEVDVNNEDSIKKAAALVAEDLMSFYEGDKPGEVPGILPGPPPNGDYYWGSGGFLWNTLIDYGNATGDIKYVDSIVKGLGWQVGQNHDFMPTNWTVGMGNDEQAIWASAALTAANSGLPGPPSVESGWLSVAQNVLAEQPLRRINNGTCEGALRWQLFPSSNGYGYIQTTSNAAFFALAAGMAQETKNDTLAKQAASSYDVMAKIGLIDDKFNVFDGTQAANECNPKTVNRLQFSSNPGLLLTGAAYMLQQTNNDETWKKRVDGLLDHTLETFFPDGVAFEVACEMPGSGYTCNVDMEQYKGMLHRSLGQTMRLAPHTKDKILPVLRTSAVAAVKTCTGGKNQRLCSSLWVTGKGQTSEGNEAASKDGAAAQMGVLSALNSVLMANVIVKPATTGGSGSGGSADGGKGQGASDSSGGNKDTPGNMGASAAVSSTVLFGGLFFSAMTFF
ncbi:glycoside hydrolase family 76 protein [Apiospora phragmitis]|uniref:Mannan endo-1,6-alpha-mannosidase n=1 Tax=Apiospora phragmitis TaxID=2905665 RepID=A0ABR1WWE8_9PEZI